MQVALKEKIYAHHPVNSGRQTELDLAKFVMIFFLALVHCAIECTPEEGLAAGIPYLLDSVIGGPLSAPMFMFAMGVGMAYTCRRCIQDHLRRGLRLCAVNYLLNICRFLIPYLIGYRITGNREKYIEPLLYLVLENDILLFAGLAMLVIALLVWLRLPDAAIFTSALLCSAVGTLLTGVDVGAPLGNILLGYLIGTEDAAGMVRSYFPLLNWLIIPACGYLFGKRLQFVRNKGLFYRALSPAGLLVAVTAFWLEISHRWGMFGEGQNCYYHLTTIDAMIALCAAVGMLGVYYLVAPRLPEWAVRIARQVSRNINSTYCIHWVILSFSVSVVLFPIRGTQELPVPVMLLSGTAISVASMAAAQAWASLRERRRGGN